MHFLESKDRIEYLADLGRKLQNYYKNSKLGLSEVIISMAEYQKWISEKNLSVSRFPVEESGFPSAPSLMQDINHLYVEAQAYEKKASKAIEDLKKGFAKTSQKVELERGFIHAPSKIYRPFIEPVKNYDNADNAIKHIIREKDGWFEIFSKTIDADKDKKKNLPSIIIDNSDELAVAGLSVAGCVLLTPLSLLLYPGLMMLKSSKQGNKKTTFLLGDVVRYFKRKKTDEVITEDEGTDISRFKYIHPKCGGLFDHPVLVNKEKESIEVICEDYDLKSTLNGVISANTNLNWILSFLTYYSFPQMGDINSFNAIYNFHPDLSRLNTEKLIKFLKSIKNSGEVDVSKELYRLNEKERANLESILQKNSDGHTISVPQQVYIDRLGILYPTPVLWVTRKETDDAFKLITQLSLDYILQGESGIPLTQFIPQLERLRQFCQNFDDPIPSILRALNLGYVYISKNQFSLKEPKVLHSKIGIPPEALKRKQKMYKKLEELSKKNIHFDKTMEGINIFSGNKKVFGNLQEIFELKNKLEQEILNLESNFKNGNIRYQKEIAETFGTVSEMKSRFETNYSKPVLELGSQLMKILDEED